MTRSLVDITAMVRRVGLARALLAVERHCIRTALDRNGNNVTRAAAELGLHRQALQRKLREIERGTAKTGSRKRARK